MNTIDGSRVKLFQLRAFVAVVDCGSFGKAGLELDLTQSAISHAIASLEDELGVVLFSRGPRGAVLTPVGSEIVAPARQMLHSLADLIGMTERSRGLTTGQVRVAAIRSLATHWLPQAIATFKQQYPQISVTITRCVNHGEVQATLKDGRADLGLMDLYRHQGLEVHELFSDSYIACLPPHAKVDPTPTWEDFRPYPLILPMPHDNSYTLLRQYLAQQPVELAIAYELNEDSAIVSMVAEGLGMTILPYLAAIPIPPEVQVRSLPQPLNRRLGAVRLDDALQSPAVYAFLETIQDLRPNLLLPINQ
ncbi:MAG: LysR family transcriptional regulator [Elainellaceae cyanobacterium]